MAIEAPDYFQPEGGLVLTHLLIVRDVNRSREFLQRVLGATVVRERQPAILRFQNSYIVINSEGGPTDDKPGVSAGGVSLEIRRRRVPPHRSPPHARPHPSRRAADVTRHDTDNIKIRMRSTPEPARDPIHRS